MLEAAVKIAQHIDRNMRLQQGIVLAEQTQILRF